MQIAGICCILLLLLSNHTSLAESNIPDSLREDLSGKVTDSTGLFLNDAHITIEAEALLDKPRTHVTDMAGNYEVLRLPIGQYLVTVEKDGYDTLMEYVTLPPGGAARHITVMYEARTVSSVLRNNKSLVAYIVVALILTVFWLVVLIDCAVKEPSTGNEKIVWIIIIVFLPLFGAIAYLVARRPKRKAL